jgi:ribulose 1,5-bisphosphate synthetase/thiazole synthase
MKHDDMKKDAPMMKKVAEKAVMGHEKRMHKMAKGGTASSRADGCAQRGKTKGTMVMCGGGKV